MLGTFDLSGPATVVLEKPFGTDLASAERLNAVLHKVFVAELARDWFVLRLGGSRQSSVRH